MKNFWLQTLPRVALGVLFLVASIDGFNYIFSGNHLIHPPTSASGIAFEDALKASGFFWPLLKTVELVGALCLLTNRAPAFGLALLSPIMAVVVLFHLVLNPGGIPMAALLIVCGGLLLRAYAPRFSALFEAGTHRPHGQKKL
jgi:putative oxidoreductase